MAGKKSKAEMNAPRTPPPVEVDPRAVIAVEVPAVEFGPVTLTHMNLGQCSRKAARGGRLLLDGFQAAKATDSSGRVPNSVPAAVRAMLERVADAHDEARKER